MELGDVLLGPIIGKVTDTTVRILLEVAVSKDYTCILSEAADEKKQHSSTIPNAPIRHVQVFTFAGLTPNTKYLVTFNTIAPNPPTLLQDVRGSFTTLPLLAGLSSMKFAAVCCNGKDPPANVNPFNVLSDHIDQKRLQYVFHIGDQVIRPWKHSNYYVLVCLCGGWLVCTFFVHYYRFA